MRKISEGFTLIEIMVVIAIIAIIVAIAIPMYQNYITRAKLAEVFSVASGVKSHVIEIYSLKNKCPINTSLSNGEVAPTDYETAIIQKIEVTSSGTGCDINVKIKPDASLATGVKGKIITLQLASTNTSGSYSWTCTSNMSTNDIGQFLPSICR